MSLPKFSDRTAWDTAETAWARTLRERRAASLPIYDLTVSNPTRCGFDYADALLEPLRNPAALSYDPNPKGLPTARAAVADYYAARRAVVDPENIFLTTGTSEAYSFLFRLLCDPGDEVLIAQPSYPLLDFLATIDDVKLISYSLFYDYGWHLDEQALRSRITPRTRALVLVHPNNPTGHYTKPAERAALEQVCAEHGLALIVDEVFLDYPIARDRSLVDPHDPHAPYTEGSASSFATGDHPVLTFVLSGLSKIAALPQMKAAWIASFGPAPRLRQASDRLEIIADTFLSMNAPIQLAMPRWLAEAPSLQSQITARNEENLAHFDAIFDKKSAVTRLKVEAGWNVILRVPATQDDDSICLTLLREHGIAIHPGSFFGFGPIGSLVASLLSEPTHITYRMNILNGLYKATA